MAKWLRWLHFNLKVEPQKMVVVEALETPLLKSCFAWMGSCYNLLICMGSYVTSQKKETKGEEKEERSSAVRRRKERGVRRFLLGTRRSKQKQEKTPHLNFCTSYSPPKQYLLLVEMGDDTKRKEPFYLKALLNREKIAWLFLKRRFEAS